MEEEQATLEGQFYEFSRLLDTKRDGSTITLWRSDYWMRQCKLLDDRKLTMTETGVAWFKYKYVYSHCYITVIYYYVTNLFSDFIL